MKSSQTLRASAKCSPLTATALAILISQISPAHAQRAQVTPAEGTSAAPANPPSDQASSLRLSLALNSPPAARAPGAFEASAWPDLLNLASQRAAVNRAADASVLAAQAQTQQARATAWMPRLDASASSTRQKQKVNALETRTPASTATLTTTLPLWRAAERSAVDVQRALAEQAVWQSKGQRASTARDLSLAYVAAGEAGEQRRIAEAQLELLQTQLHVNQRRLQGGLGTVLDELETRTRIDQARATIQELGMRATTQRLVLERLSGEAVRLPSGFKLQAPMQADLLPSLEEALQLAERGNPQWQDSQAELQAAKATSTTRDAEAWHPSIDAVASASRTRQTQTFEGVSDKQSITSRAWGLQLSWPLFTGGYQQGRTREAAALLTRSQARLDDTVAAVQTNLRDAYQNLAQAQAILAAQQSVEATATATFDAIRKAFVAGKRTNIDLLNAQAQIYAARQNLVSARITALTAHINILYLLDQLDAAHVAPLVAQFDTEAMSASQAPMTP